MHSSTELKRVLFFRKKNKSYSQIQKLTNISKSTLSDWLSKEDWSVKIKNELSAKQIKKYKINIIRANEVRFKQMKMRESRFITEAQNEYLALKSNALFVYGLGIYWGEGDKKSRDRVAVINTDQNLLRIEAKFYRECLKIKESKLRIELFIYKDINKAKAIKFWSTVLNIPKSQFIKTQILESKAKLTKTKSKYGICSLYCSNTELSIKIREWIRLLTLDLQV